MSASGNDVMGLLASRAVTETLPPQTMAFRPLIISKVWMGGAAFFHNCCFVKRVLLLSQDFCCLWFRFSFVHAMVSVTCSVYLWTCSVYLRTGVDVCGGGGCSHSGFSLYRGDAGTNMSNNTQSCQQCVS